MFNFTSAMVGMGISMSSVGFMVLIDSALEKRKASTVWLSVISIILGITLARGFY